MPATAAMTMRYGSVTGLACPSPSPAKPLPGRSSTLRGVTPVADMPAPGFALPSTNGGPVALADLLAAGPAVVMFVTDDCPTCELTLRRLAAAGADVTVVCEAAPAAAVPPRGTDRIRRPDVVGAGAVRDVARLRARGRADDRRDRAVRRGDRDRRRLGGCRALARFSRPTSAPSPPTRKPGLRGQVDVRRRPAGRRCGDRRRRPGGDVRARLDGRPADRRAHARAGGGDAGRARSVRLARPRRRRAWALRRSSGWRRAPSWPGAGPSTSPSSRRPSGRCSSPGFNLHGQAVTTQPAGQIAVVNGPVRQPPG